MHGEYKTPGGKLVRVDFEADGGALRDVVVSGDFFLYPEEALDAISGSLEGVPADLSEDEIAAQRRRGDPAGTEWLGSSPEALAIAVRRALAGGGVIDERSTRSASAIAGDGRRAGARYDWQLIPAVAAAAADEHGARRGADRCGSAAASARRRSASGAGATAASSSAASSRSATRSTKTAAREHGVADRAADQRRRRDVHRAGGRDHLVDLRPGGAGAGDDLRRVVRLLRRLGGRGAARRSGSTPGTRRSTTSPPPAARSAARPRPAAAAPCSTTRRWPTR